MPVSEIRVKQIPVNQGLGIVTLQRKMFRDTGNILGQK